MNRITCLLLLKILLICSFNKKLTDAEDLSSAVSKTYQSHNIRSNLNLIRNWILNKNSNNNYEKTNLIEDSRTFGRIRRLQFMMLPIMFKLGVMSTLMLVLLALAIKGVIIGKILLMINFGIIVAKIVAAYTAFIAKSKLSLHNKSWNDHGTYDYPKDVHVHIHTNNNRPYYSGYETNYVKNEKWPSRSQEGWYPPSSNFDYKNNNYHYNTISDYQPSISN